jgi:peptidyl-prolyl cis-trans isomerase C
MTASRLLLAALAVAALAACSQKPAAPKEDIVATVDGVNVTRNTFEQYVAGVTEKPVSEVPEEQRKELLDTLVRAYVVAGEAQRSGVTAKPEVAAALEIQRLTLLQRASGQDLFKDTKPSEEELRAEYDLRVEKMDKTQYRLSHIVVATPEEANQLIAQLDKGANFAALASQHSLDNNTKAKGGDLSWAPPSGMPASFAVAVGELKKGDIAKTPLKTELGWHVIQVMDTRESSAPPFENVQDALVQGVQEKQFNAWIDGLAAKAKITKTP